MISTPGDHLPPEVVYTKAFLVAIKLASLPAIRSSKAADKEQRIAMENIGYGQQYRNIRRHYFSQQR